MLITERHSRRICDLDKMYLRGGVFVLLLVAISASGGFYDTDTSLDKIWQAYKQQHSKNYESDKEEQLRRGIWERNVDVIKRHNLEYDLGLHTFTMGINEYADLTFAEYQKYLLGAKPELRGKSGGDRRQYKPNLSAPLPTNVDWRQQGYVTPVKNQGQCGSCWAFSSTGALEGQHFRRTKQLVSLSEQNLVDCVTMNAGCGGGWMDNAFIYVERNMGIDTESSYPYETKQGGCRFKPDSVGASASSLVDIPSYHEDYLKSAVAQEGPIAVAIDAAHQSFQLYKSGVYFEPECSHNATDHAVLAVGYGTTNTGYDYWLVKNSWGASWGEEGYIKMARDYDNMCAIATFASFPLSSDGTN